MTTAPPFDGKGSVEDFISALDRLLMNVPDHERLSIAMPLVQGDAAAVIQRLEYFIKFVDPTWEWTWSRLRTALIKIDEQFDSENSEKTKKIVKGVLIGTALAVGAPVAIVGTLGLIGFGAAGVVGGSVAAGIQSTFYGAATGGLFSFCQSAAAGGYALATVQAAAATGGAVTGTVAAIAGRSPSRSWKDGDVFVPSKKLLEAFVQTDLEKQPSTGEDVSSSISV